LGKILPTFEIEHDNVSNHWQALKDVILSVVDRVAPLKKFRQKSEVDLPYFDKELVRLASIRDKSYKQAIVEKDPMKRKELYAYFQSDRNAFQSAIKKRNTNIIIRKLKKNRFLQKNYGK
jgi:dsDNA-binding SOS-regulon protein